MGGCIKCVTNQHHLEWIFLHDKKKMGAKSGSSSEEIAMRGGQKWGVKIMNRLVSYSVVLMMMVRSGFAVNRCVLKMITTRMLLRMMLCQWCRLNLHMFKFMLIRRHQFHFTIKSVLLLLLLVLLRHHHLQGLLWVVLVGVDELRRVARHEHDVLSPGWEGLSGSTGSWRRLGAGMESGLMCLTRRGSRRWGRRHQVRRDVWLRLGFVLIHADRRRRICLRGHGLHLMGRVEGLHDLLRNLRVEDRLASRLAHVELLEFLREVKEPLGICGNIFAFVLLLLRTVIAGGGVGRCWGWTQ